MRCVKPLSDCLRVWPCSGPGTPESFEQRVLNEWSTRKRITHLTAIIRHVRKLLKVEWAHLQGNQASRTGEQSTGFLLTHLLADSIWTKCFSGKSLDLVVIELLPFVDSQWRFWSRTPLSADAIVTETTASLFLLLKVVGYILFSCTINYINQSLIQIKIFLRVCKVSQSTTQIYFPRRPQNRQLSGLHFLFLLFKERWRGEVESNFYFWYIIMVLTESIIFSKSKYSLLRWHKNIPRSQDQKDNRDKMLRN